VIFRKTLATTRRVLRQLSHDRRTIALIVIVPPMLLVLLKYVFQGEPRLFQNIAPMLLGIFPMMMMFLISSIVTLRERSSGTLSRLMTMPISKSDFIFGYALAFALLGFVQALISGGTILWLLDVTVLGGTLPVLLIAVLASFLGTAMGLFTSAFARSEFQAIQFLPAFLLPQILVCGLFVTRDAMAKPLQWIADVMPLSYSVDAMNRVTHQAVWTGTLTKDLAVVVGFALVFLVLASATIRRQD
jgi:ABC transporter DrrB family efflux protein